MKPCFLALVLVLLPLAASAETAAPLRVEVEYDGALWIAGEYILTIESLMAIAPVMSLGDIDAKDAKLGIGARLYPFSQYGQGLFVDFQGRYQYSSGQLLTPQFVSESAGLGFRLILLKHLTGIVEGGVSLRNDDQAKSFVGMLGFGFAM